MPDITKTRALSIGDVARLSGANIETIRYYERIGLLPEPARTAGGNRQYDETGLKRLFFVRRARELGFSIAEIRGLLDMADSDEMSCAVVHARTQAHLSEVRAKISALRKLEKTLAGMAAQCSRGDVPDCPILDSLFEGLPG